MNNHVEHGTLPQSSRFGLPAAYQQRLQPDYFADTADDGITWQPDVYPHAAGLALDLGRNVIIDIGCGRAGKIALLQHDQPQWHYIGVDYGPNIEWCRANHSFGDWIEADLETCTALAVPISQLSRAVIVCSDVLEHLVRPDVAMRMMLTLAATGGSAPVVLSTPARERRAGATYLGQPQRQPQQQTRSSPEQQTPERPRQGVQSDLNQPDRRGHGVAVRNTLPANGSTTQRPSRHV